MRHLAPHVHEFEGHPVSTLSYRGRPVWIAREVGEAIGYAQGGKRFATSVTGEWAEELIEGHDFVVVEGAELEQLRALLPKGTDSVPFESRRGLVLLLETGLHLALIKTRKPAGRRLRRFLAEQVLPQLVRTGAYVPEQRPEAIVGGEQLQLLREQRLAQALDLQDRRFRASALQQLLNTLSGLGHLPDDIRAAYEVVAAEIALGADFSALKPTIEPDWLSPSQIADRFKVTANRVGRVISKLDLRGKEGLSRSIVNKARGHNKTVQSWLYSPQAVQLIEEELVASGVVPEAN